MFLGKSFHQVEVRGFEGWRSWVWGFLCGQEVLLGLPSSLSAQSGLIPAGRILAHEVSAGKVGSPSVSAAYEAVFASATPTLELVSVSESIDDA